MLLTLEDWLILIGWLLFLLILGFTRFRPRFRVFRTPIFLIVLSATVSRTTVLLQMERFTTVVNFLYAFAIAFLIARVIVFVSFDLVMDRRREIPTPALIKTLIFFGLLLISLFFLNENLPEDQRVPLTSLVASAAVITVVLGFALQDTLGNLFSGLALHLEHPIKVGHWIKVGDSTGQVIEMDWRSIKLRTLSYDYHILPNSLVASQRIINYNDPPRSHRREIRIRAPYSSSPDNVISAIMPILEDNANIEKLPPPYVIVRDFGDHWIEYEIRYWYRDFALLEKVDGDIRRQIWYSYQRDKITSPVPVRDVFLHEVKPEKIEREQRLKEMEKLMRSISIFEPLSDDEFRQVHEGMHFAPFASGETIIRQGEEGDSFFVIYYGEAEVTVRQHDGDSSVVKILGPGDYFGEMALLTGERRAATITALTECGCFVVEKPQLKKLLEHNPAIAEALSKMLSSRKAELDEQISALEAEWERRHEKEKGLDLSKKILIKIKSWFGLK